MENEKIYRKVDLTLDANTENPNVFYASVSSEKPVLRKTKTGDQYYEVLSHDPNSLDMSMSIDGQVHLLFNHEEDKSLGYVDQFSIDEVERKARVRITFAETDDAQQYLKEVQSGKWKGLSIGAMPIKVERSGAIAGIPVAKISTWAPFEVSLVTIPVDTSVGINRSLEGSEEVSDLNLSDVPDEAKETTDATTEVQTVEADDSVSITEEEPILETEQKEELIEQTTNLENVEIVERHFNIKENKMDNMETNKVIMPEPVDFGSEKALRGYSVGKMVADLVEGNLSGLEAEVSQEMVKKGYSYKSIPTEAIVRSLNFTDANSGKEMNVPSNGGYIEALLPQSVIGKLGLQNLGLTNETSFPRFAPISANGPAVKGEKSGATPEATVPTSAVSFVPNEITSRIQLSRRMLKFSAAGLDSMITRQLSAETLKKIDNLAFTTMLAEITKADATATAWNTALAVTAALNLQTLVAADTDLTETCKYVASYAVLNALKTQARAAAGVLPYPVNAGNEVWDQQAIASSNMPLVATKTPLVFGDWSWAGYSTFGQSPLEIEVENVADGAGMVNIIGYSYFDAHILQAAAFSKIVTAV